MSALRAKIRSWLSKLRFRASKASRVIPPPPTSASDPYPRTRPWARQNHSYRS